MFQTCFDLFTTVYLVITFFTVCVSRKSLENLLLLLCDSCVTLCSNYYESKSAETLQTPRFWSAGLAAAPCLHNAVLLVLLTGAAHRVPPAGRERRHGESRIAQESKTAMALNCLFRPWLYTVWVVVVL